MRQPVPEHDEHREPAASRSGGSTSMIDGYEHGSSTQANTRYR
jgi:hypothetical protein